MSVDKTWRGDPWIMARLRGGLPPWHVSVEVCADPCWTQNLAVAERCRTCGEVLPGNPEWLTTVERLIEMEVYVKREQAYRDIESIITAPFDPNESGEFAALPPAEPEPLTMSQRVLTMVWILICIGFVAALAAISQCRGGNF